MKKTVISLVISFFLILNLSVTYGQSLKGRVWQSQDTNLNNIKPSTLVFNTDGTFYKIEHTLNTSSSGKLFVLYYKFDSEGTYTEAKSKLVFTPYYDNRPNRSFEWVITWINDSEFSVKLGLHTQHFCELGSNNDIFTQNCLYPHIRMKVKDKQNIDPCFSKIVEQIKGGDLISNKKKNMLIDKTSLIGTVWVMQPDTNHLISGRINTIEFTPDGVLKEVIYNYYNEEITSLEFGPEKKYKEINIGEITVSKNDQTKSSPYPVEWKSGDKLLINGYYYARFASESDLFSKKFLEVYARKLIDNKMDVNPSYLEYFVKNRRTVSGRIYYCQDNQINKTKYQVLTFHDNGNYGRCDIQTGGILPQYKFYKQINDKLYFAKYKLLGDAKKVTVWEEEYVIKWINSQKFILSKDGVDVQYNFHGIYIEPATEL